MSKPEVRETIEHISNLPTLPTILTQILAAAADPESSAADLGRHIASDQSLSAALLRLVNSAAYGRYREVKDITSAIVMLGFFEVRNLALSATCFRRFTKAEKRSSEYDLTQLWRHSLASAMACERLAKRMQLDAGSAFVAGLLHDIGKLVLDMLYPEEYARAYQRARLEGKHVRELETELFDMDHAIAGSLLAEHWNLPQSIVDAIRYHHDPASAADDARFAVLTSWSDYITYQSGLGENSNGLDTQMPDHRELLDIPEDTWRPVVKDLEGAHERINQILGILRS